MHIAQGGGGGGGITPSPLSSGRGPTCLLFTFILFIFLRLLSPPPPLFHKATIFFRVAGAGDARGRPFWLEPEPFFWLRLLLPLLLLLLLPLL